MPYISKWNGYDLKDARAREIIGSLSLLATEDKTSIVAAINELVVRVAAIEDSIVPEPEGPVNLLNLNRVQGENWDSEDNYIQPVNFNYTVIQTGSCTIADLTEDSITVTESGAGNTGAVFPWCLFGNYASRAGKSYVFSWNPTGSTNTRLRLMMMDGASTQNATFSNKDGAIGSGTIDISADRKTITVNGTAYTFTNEVVRLGFFFGSATGKTCSYTGVSLMEVAE